MDPKLIFVLLLHVIQVYNEKLQRATICVIGDPKDSGKYTGKYCNRLKDANGNPVTCVYRTDRLECLKTVSKRKADFMVMHPEVLYLSTLWDESDILVVSEIRSISSQEYKYAAVVAARSDLNATGADLRGRKLCHRGMKSGLKWNNLFERYLEERLAPANCDPEFTVVEDRIRATFDYFGVSCIAGPWTEDKQEDLRLKGQYSKMCSLCYEGDCNNEEKYLGSGSILCLTDGVGDFVWTRYDEVNSYVKRFDQDYATNYKFLCEDGSLMSLDAKDPCLWLAMPWPVIAANRKSSEIVKKIFQDFGSSGWQQYVSMMIELDDPYVVNLNTSKSPEDYLRLIPGYLDAVEIAQSNCKSKHFVRLCVTSTLEHEKCSWLSKVVSSLAIQPPLVCHRRANISECMESVHAATSDVVVVPNDYVYDAIRSYGLKSLYCALPKIEEDGYALSVYHNGNHEVTSFEQLRGKKACFTRVGGIGWRRVSTLLTANESKALSCSHERMTEYFSDVCVVEKDSSGRIPPCGNESGSVSGRTADVDALKCLTEGLCDVAFVDGHAAKGGDHMMPGNLLVVDERIAWESKYTSYLMTSPERTAIKTREIVSFFSQIDEAFGKTSKNRNDIMEIFGPYDGVNDVLFRDTTLKFATCFENEVEEILEDLMCSTSSITCPSGSAIVLYLIFVLSNSI